ncbi:5223_t:CDS:2, partial [Scutellospora calospora]
IMTNDKFKPVQNVPKTYEVRYLEVKEPSKLSKLASYLGMKTVDNCSYSGCSYSTDFDIKEVGKLVFELPTMSQVNLYGEHCAEDNKFCNCALEFIRKAIRHHERGYEVRDNKRITSDISYWSRYTFTTGAAIGASLINPAAAVAIGASVYGVGAVVHNENELVRNIKNINGAITEEGIKHVIHQTLGQNYDSDCLICKYEVEIKDKKTNQTTKLTKEEEVELEYTVHSTTFDVGLRRFSGRGKKTIQVDKDSKKYNLLLEGEVKKG